jgi:hypothetical protein
MRLIFLLIWQKHKNSSPTTPQTNLLFIPSCYSRASRAYISARGKDLLSPCKPSRTPATLALATACARARPRDSPTSSPRTRPTASLLPTPRTGARARPRRTDEPAEVRVTEAGRRTGAPGRPRRRSGTASGLEPRGGAGRSEEDRRR